MCAFLGSFCLRAKPLYDKSKKRAQAGQFARKGVVSGVLHCDTLKFYGIVKTGNFSGGVAIHLSYSSPVKDRK